MSSPVPRGQVGRVAQHAGVVDEARCAHPHRCDLVIDGVAQLLGHRGQGLDHELEPLVVGPVVLGAAPAGRGHPHLGQHDALVVHGEAEHLGAPHVDPDRHLPRHADLLCRCSSVSGGPAAHVVSEDSTRALSSSSAVCMIRLCALRLMNPGSGTRSSTSRAVGDLGGSVPGALEAVAAVELGGEIAGGLLPGQGPGRPRVVIGEGVAGGPAEGTGPEGRLGGPALVVTALDHDLLDVGRPLRVPLDVAHHTEALLRRGGDDHALGGQFRHRHSF